MSGRRWLLLHNVGAGQSDGGERLAAIRGALAESDIELTVAPPGSAGGARDLARDAARDDSGFDAVLAYGGDGTVANAAQALAGTRLPVGPLPGGTANVLVRELGLPLDPVEAARRLARGTVRLRDVGRAAGQPFLLMCGAGPDAAILRDVSPSLKRRFGRGAIAIATLRNLAGAPLPRFEVELQEPAEGRIEAMAAVVANSRLYGGPFPVAPKADPADGWLDLVLFRGRRRRDLFRWLAAIPSGGHVRASDVSVHRVRRVTIRPLTDPPGWWQADGDAMGAAPVEVSIDPGALRLLGPAD